MSSRHQKQGDAVNLIAAQRPDLALSRSRPQNGPIAFKDMLDQFVVCVGKEYLGLAQNSDVMGMLFQEDEILLEGYLLSDKEI